MSRRRRACPSLASPAAAAAPPGRAARASRADDLRADLVEGVRLVLDDGAFAGLRHNGPPRHGHAVDAVDGRHRAAVLSRRAEPHLVRESDGQDERRGDARLLVAVPVDEVVRVVGADRGDRRGEEVVPASEPRPHVVADDNLARPHRCRRRLAVVVAVVPRHERRSLVVRAAFEVVSQVPRDLQLRRRRGALVVRRHTRERDSDGFVVRRLVLARPLGSRILVVRETTLERRIGFTSPGIIG